MLRERKGDKVGACPTCGRPLPSPISRADQLVALMRGHDPNRDVYAAKNGGYFATSGGGRVAKAAIDEALSQNLIVEKFPGRGHEYWSLRED